MLKHYGIDRSQAMAFGDGNNDIEMLKAGMTLSYMVNDEYDFFINFSKGDDVKQKLKEEFRYAF